MFRNGTIYFIIKLKFSENTDSDTYLPSTVPGETIVAL